VRLKGIDFGGGEALGGKNDIYEIKKTLSKCNDADKKEILSRLLFHQCGFKHCHVIRDDNKIAYMQWIIYPTENVIIHEFGLLPLAIIRFLLSIKDDLHYFSSKCAFA
jgi:hypothetical protein